MIKILQKLLAQIAQGLKAALPILLVTIFVLLNVAIWWAGPWINISDSHPLSTVMARTLTSTIFSLACLTLWGLFQWKTLRSLQADQAHDQQLKEDPIKRFEECQEQDLNQVMTGLKKSLNKHNYLYTLPWYLVLGLENSGKTSLINRSGQKFVFSSVIRASGNRTANPFTFDWWIGDHSVLIDPDGELLTQGMTDQDKDGQITRRLWLHFVSWLEKKRSRRPLNGVVIALDIAHLATATNSERAAYANLIRTRLRELMETLSTRLPVYIALTKLDLLHGFEPFFRSYSRDEREQVLGFTFTLSSVDDLDHWLEEFNKEFCDFVERINKILPVALIQCFDAEDRAAIYSFSRQMAGLNDVLRQFLVDAFGSDQFSTSALVRGVYFTSVYQQGVPTDAFVDSASRRYRVPISVNYPQAAENSTTYFTQKLFSQIIYPEAGLASDNFRVAKTKRKIMTLSIVACIIASALLVGTWHQYYLKNIRQADAVLSKVNTYRNHQISDVLLDNGRDILGPLNTIREATLEFGFFRDKPLYLSDFGLYQGHLIGPEVERAYLNLLEYRYLPALMKQVTANLAMADSDEEKLTALRVYRMMTDKSGRYQRMVQSYFASQWQSRYPGDRQTQEYLMQHLDYAMQHTDLRGEINDGNRELITVMEPYDQLISNAQQDIGNQPIEQRVYRNLKQTASATLGAPVNLATQIGPVFDLVYTLREAESEKLEIPRMLTKKGFESYFVPQSDAISEQALIDGWVLGQSDATDFSDEDKRVLREKIRTQYVTDYSDTWRRAINDIDIKYFTDINSAVQSLEIITGNSQPLNRLLDEVTENTLLFPPLPDDDAARDELMKMPKYQVAALIDNQFSGLNSLLNQEPDKPSYMEEVSTAINQLLAYMKSISEAPDVGKAALEATKARLTLTSADPIYVLDRIASGMPRPYDSMLHNLAEENWYVVKQEAIRYLGVRWSEDIYSVYEEKFASRYPFNSNASKDVALDDFEAFFAPDGTLNTFYRDNLKLFLDNDSSLNSTPDGKSLIHQNVLDQLAIAQAIQQAFFNRKGIMDVQFSLEPIEMSASKRRSIINIDGQYVEYNHGPRKTTGLVWPNTLRESTASKVTLVPSAANESPRSVSYQGPWAFFRLLDNSEVVASTTTSVDYRFNIDQGYVTYRLNSEADSNPFTVSLFKSFSVPESLY
jgi:type VI secretion system protein ImpL